MQIAMVGLGRMGANMVRRLLKQGHAILGFAGRGLIVIEKFCLFVRPAALAGCLDDENAVHPLYRDVQPVTGLHHVARLAHKRAIDLDIARLDVGLGYRAGLCHTGKEQPLVEALTPRFQWLFLSTHRLTSSAAP